MSKSDPTHDEKLAAALRENLKRRKAQAREADAAPREQPDDRD